MMTDSRLAALNSAIQALAAASEFTRVMSRIVTSAAKLANAQCAFLVLFNKNTKQWEVRLAHGAEIAPASDRAASAREVALSGEPITGDSFVALPLKVRGVVVGALQVERSGGLAEEDRPALETFAAAAALALDATLSKTDFVSTVTHELRLPMTSIKGYTDLIRGGMAGPVSDMQKQLLDTVRNNVDWMNSLVSDLSDIAKVETGRLKVDIELVDTAAVVEKAAAALRPQFESKTQTLAVSAQTLLYIRADRRRLTQMLTYLLTNAHRYTASNGQIALRAEPDGSFVRFTVTDNGVGMNPADKAKLFTQFFRSEDMVVRDHKGWGLALHLVKRLAELFGGEIGAESEYGKGSTFWFTLPVAQ
ncbi:MAG TPA: HAMP domain-containing sensor histidine kinase [Anaerolineales bacterium]|nr:HAMP domain-containing sensor histidine kinase [Anaerolineales bacterium]